MTENQSKLTKFNPENSDLITQLIFDDRVTKPMLMIYKYLSIPVKDKETKKIYKRTAYSARGISLMMGLTLNMTIRSLKSLRDLKFIELANNKYFIISLDLNLDQDKDSDLPVDQIRSTHRSESDLPVDHNITEEIYLNNITENIPKNENQDEFFEKYGFRKGQFACIGLTDEKAIELREAIGNDVLERTPIYLSPESKILIHKGNVSLNPTQELELPTQIPTLPPNNSTPSILDDLGDDFVPELVLQNKEKFNALQEIKKGTISTNVHGDKIIQLKDGKTNSKSYRNLFFTDKEREKLKEYYERNGLKEYLIFGLVKLNDYPLSNLKNFTKYKSHYSVMIGWVAKACQEQKILDEREQRGKK
jgi:hypothetical protein